VRFEVDTLAFLAGLRSGSASAALAALTAAARALARRVGQQSEQYLRACPVRGRPQSWSPSGRDIVPTHQVSGQPGEGQRHLSPIPRAVRGVVGRGDDPLGWNRLLSRADHMLLSCAASCRPIAREAGSRRSQSPTSLRGSACGSRRRLMSSRRRPEPRRRLRIPWYLLRDSCTVQIGGHSTPSKARQAEARGASGALLAGLRQVGSPPVLDHPGQHASRFGAWIEGLEAPEHELGGILGYLLGPAHPVAAVLVHHAEPSERLGNVGDPLLLRPCDLEALTPAEVDPPSITGRIPISSVRAISSSARQNCDRIELSDTRNTTTVAVVTASSRASA
jgi:hypothetical protein